MPGGRPKGSISKPPEAKAFVAGVERRLAKGGITDALENLACRFVTGEDTKVAFGVWAKLMEYKFGKATEHIEHNVKVEMTVSDADRIIAGYMAEFASNRAGEASTSN